jgi:hypothetical protein
VPEKESDMTFANTLNHMAVKADRHIKRMVAQAVPNKVPRGTARNLRRKLLQVTYAKRMAAADKAAAAASAQ